MRQLYALFAVMALSLFLVACETRDNRPATRTGDDRLAERAEKSAEDIGDRVDEAWEDTKNWTEDVFTDRQAVVRNYTFEQRDKFKDRVSTIIDRYEDRLDKWKETSGDAIKDRTTANTKPINELEAKIQTARDNLSKVGDATVSTWPAVRTNVDNALADLRTTFSKYSVPTVTVKIN